MRYLQPALLITILLLLFACGTDSEKEEQLQGNWSATYIEKGGEEVSGQSVAFTFEGTAYTYTAGSHQEEGEFWVEGSKLYTEGPQVMKKSVEIQKLTADSLVLGMNDKGVPMKMIFER